RFLTKRAGNIAAAEARAKGYIWPILIVLIVFVMGIVGIVEYKFDSKKQPVAAVEFLLQEHIPGNMFNNDEFGDYLIYAAYPQYKVFFDGRSDMYGTAHTKKYLKVARLENKWEEVIAEYDIGWVFYNADSLVSRYLMERPDWRLIYADKVAHIYVRNKLEYQNLIGKYPEVVPVIYDEENSSFTTEKKYKKEKRKLTSCPFLLSIFRYKLVSLPDVV
ncbi:MAG: hypothetical protein JW902_00955, partial [Syntrophaceae bacterium]|nr:hypothetical protein [Syntrophaceae bacterium]